MVYDTPPGLWRGFRTPPLIRFLSGEGAYVSPAQGGPVLYINLEDHLRVSENRINNEFMVRQGGWWRVWRLFGGVWRVVKGVWWRVVEGGEGCWRVVEGCRRLLW